MPKLSNNFDRNYHDIKNRLPEGPDIVIRSFLISGLQKAVLFYIDNLVDKAIIGEHIIKPMVKYHTEKILSAEEISENVIQTGGVTPEEDRDKLLDAILGGLAVLIIEHSSIGFIIDVIRGDARSIAEPATDVVIRGPREGFIEILQINLSLLRRKIHHPDLVFEIQKIGRYSNTQVALVYISSIVNKDVLSELKRRLKKIDIDGILESGYIEELITDNPFSPFPQIGSTEKPDIVAAKILEGRVALMVDGTPIALTVPMLFVEGFQSSEDYYANYYYASIIRIIRYLAFFISTLLPALYVAIVNYHQELIPMRLLLTMAAAEENMPFSPAMGVMIMGVVYEILKESGVRLPRPVGQAISIVGALVMGQAAVSAGLISSPVLIVVAITVIASFVTVPLVGIATVFRIIFFFSAWALGFFGILAALLFTLLYLASLRSFGVPYFAPVAPLFPKELGDVFLRLPIWLLQKRPKELSKNRRRMSRSMREEINKEV